MAAENTSPADRVKGILSSFLRDVASDEVIGSPNADNTEQTSPSLKTPSERSRIKFRSRDAFFARIETYWPSRWFAKTSSLSPLVCSKYGWENVDEDLLKCVSCGAHLSGEMPDPSSDTFDECCSALRSSLVSAHKKFCYWSTNPCPDSFLQVPHYNYSDVRKEARLSYQHLLELKLALPALDFSSMDRWGFSEESAKELAEKLELSSGVMQLSSRSAALAVTGWTTSSNSDVIVCSHCRRQVGLWNFKSSNGDSADGDSAGVEGANGDSNSSVEPQAKKRRLSSDSSAKSLDPVEEHRHWCPWITNQEGSDPVPPEDPSGLWSGPHRSSERTDGGDAIGVSASPKAKEARLGAGEGARESSSNAVGVQTSGREGGGGERGGEAGRDLANTPGWLRTAKVILSEGGCHGEECSLRNLKQNSVDGLRSIRRLLRDWSSPLTQTN